MLIAIILVFGLTPKKVEKIEVVLLENSLTKHTGPTNAGSKPRGKSNGVAKIPTSVKSRSLALRALSPQLNFGTKNLGVSDKKTMPGSLSIHDDTFEGSPNSDDPLKAWGSGGGSFGRIKDYLLYKKIHDQIDGILFFPSFFNRHKIQGVSNARLVLNEEGNCNWQHTDIQGTNAYIQLYVLSVLKKTCEQNYKRYMGNRSLTNIDLSFQFALTEDLDKEYRDKNQYIVGNTLLFYRNSVKSLFEWEFGPFQGVFPIPAIYLNIGWIKENWEKIMESKDPISVFKKEFGGG